MFRHFAKSLILVSLLGLNACDDVPDISLPNEPPVAVDDTVAIKQNQPIIIQILANDIDIDGDPLTIIVTTPPSNGTVVNLTGAIRYTPDQYFVGSDELTYEITDLVGHTATAVVSIEVSRRETRAIFSTVSGTEKRLYMLDSRNADTLIDLTQSLDAGEMLLNWAISEQLDLAVLLTDADRVLTVPLDDPATPANAYEIDTTNGEVDGGLVVSNLGTVAVYTLANRYAVAIDLNNLIAPGEFDTAFETGTMLPSFFVPVDNAIIMQGTIGTDAEERSAIYYVPLSTIAPIAILDDAQILQSTFTRELDGLNGMAWLLDDATAPLVPAAYSCATPPPQTLSALSYTALGAPNADAVNLNNASGMLPDPTTLIAYYNGSFATSVLVAACLPDIDIVQIVEIPFVTPTSARILATADDASDGLWNIDVGLGGEKIVYVLDGDTGLRTRTIDKTDPDLAVSDLSSTVPDFQTYDAGAGLRLPPSAFSTDGLRWLFLAPVNDALTRVEWLQLETLELSTLDLPFTATNVVSDGFFVFVQGETADPGSAPVALIELNNPQVTAVDVPGALAETQTDPLNQIESAVGLYTVP